MEIEEVLKERERIKRIVEDKKTSVNMICDYRKNKKARHSIAKSRVLRILDNIIYRIEHPEHKGRYDD